MSTCLAIPQSQPLGAALELFSRFGQTGIRYCHFKSNEHLGAGLSGHTDLDILVDRHQAREAELALVEAGFQRFLPSLGYPSIEDYLGFDYGTGHLLHVHLHYNLVAGEKDLKGYNLGARDALLRTRIVDPASGIFVSEPNHEMLLLLVRSALKIRWRDYLAALLGRSRLRGQTAREFRWLAERTEIARIEAIASRELGARAAELVRDLAAAPPTVWQLRAFRSRAAAALSWDRIYGPVEGRIVRLARAAFRLAGGVNARYLRLPLAFRRTHRAGGCVVAFLGMDGSGKSTITAQVRRWLAWKVDVYPVYFGSGVGTASALRWPMKVMVDKFRHTSAVRLLRGSRPGGANRDGGNRDRRITWAVALWALVLAREKRSKLRRLHRARSRGMIVICDRYPQVQVAGYNDGPLLGSWLVGGSDLRRRLARWELDNYQRATQLRPDLVIKLDLPPEVAARRKPEMTLEELGRRRQAVRDVHYGETCRYAEIDASAPLEKVLLAVKRAIWEAL